jgi:aspartate racemase
LNQLAGQLMAYFAAHFPKNSGMKTIGLIGGMSWESTALYYQHINREVARRHGGLRSARVHLISLDFQEIAELQKQGDWPRMTEILQTSARQLESSGAEVLLICTNTMHRIAQEVQSVTALPLLHIADVTADAILAAGLNKVGLLGTRFTMEQAFMRDRLATKGIECVVPDEPGRIEVHRVIFEELCRGQVLASSRRAVVGLIAALQRAGAQAKNRRGAAEAASSRESGDSRLQKPKQQSHKAG